MDIYGHLLLYIWEIFKIFNKLFGLIFSVPIRTPKMCLLVRLMILHKILTLSSLLFILFPSLPELLPVLSLSSLILSSAQDPGRKIIIARIVTDPLRQFIVIFFAETDLRSSESFEGSLRITPR